MRTDSRLTILTASMPGREWGLAAAAASVTAQTVRPKAHLIRIAEPPERYGPSPVGISEQRNALVAAADTEWVLNLDDDDVLLPSYIAEAGRCFDHADVVYAFDARRTAEVARVDVTAWTSEQLVAQLERQNIISSCAAIRRQTILDVGGYPADLKIYSGTFKGTPCTWEDWALWYRLAQAGARFVCIPKDLWEYRFDPNISSQIVWRDRLTRMQGAPV